MQALCRLGCVIHAFPYDLWQPLYAEEEAKEEEDDHRWWQLDGQIC
jgi:hypothetical protein